MIRKLFIVVLVVFTAGAALALKPVDLNKYYSLIPAHKIMENGKPVPFHFVREAYGEWEQLIVTTSGTYHIIFHEVHDTWRTHPGPQYREIYVPTYGGIHTIHLDLLEKMDLLEIVNPKDRIALVFKNEFEWIEKTKNDGHHRWFFHVDCLKPFVAMKSYWIMKPKIRENYFRKSITYKKVVVDLSNDRYIDSNGITDNFKAEQPAWNIPDKTVLNADGNVWRQPKFLRQYAEHTSKDSNNDGIKDMTQTFNAYVFNENSNFIDANGDTLCDNYSEGIYNSDKQQAVYTDLTFDLRKDPFQNRQVLVDLGMGVYTDRNKDGINDRFQKIELTSRGYVAIYFIDKNNDTISDYWQTLDGYQRLKIDNFIDLDGDGLCDNYLRN